MISNRALYYGKLACDTMMKRYQATDLPPKGGFHYHQGVFLSGMMNIYSVCGDEKYFNYMKDWVDSIVTEPGVIRWFNKGALDDYMAGIHLVALYERTGDEKYYAAMQLQMGNLRNWRRNSYGGFWHMEWRENQMWLDGLYMAGPVQMYYAKLFDAPYLAEQAVEQAFIMYEHMQDKETGLMYHAWDPTFAAPWSNKVTGLSEEFWGRAMGWYVVAVLDLMEHMDPNSNKYKRLAAIERDVLSAIVKYQDPESGAWYQVVNKGSCSDNWHESSCSCLNTYAIAKAVRMGVVDSSFTSAAQKGFEAVIREFITVDNDHLSMCGICIGTGVLKYDGYINRPTSVNDLHGMGAFLLMCAEIARTGQCNPQTA